MAWSALLLAIAAVSWGSILARLCDLPALSIGFGRLWMATLLLVPFGLPSMRRRPPDAATLRAAGWAGLMLALHFALWIGSLAYTTVAASTLLVSTAPAASAILSWIFLGERPGPRALAGIALAVAGAATIAAADRTLGEGHLLGDVLALGGAVCAAGYFAVGRAARHRAPFPAYLLLVNLSATLWAGLFAAAGGAPVSPGSARNLALFAAMAAGPQILGHGALNWSVRRLRVYVVQLAVLGEPLLASLWALMIFGEVPPPSVAPGALMIVAGIALVVYAERGPRVRDAPAGAL